MDEAGSTVSSEVLNQTTHVLQHLKMVNSATPGWSITELSDVPSPTHHTFNTPSQVPAFPDSFPSLTCMLLHAASIESHRVGTSLFVHRLAT